MSTPDVHVFSSLPTAQLTQGESELHLVPQRFYGCGMFGKLDEAAGTSNKPIAAPFCDTALRAWASDGPVTLTSVQQNVALHITWLKVRHRRRQNCHAGHCLLLGIVLARCTAVFHGV